MAWCKHVVHMANNNIRTLSMNVDIEPAGKTQIPEIDAVYRHTYVHACFCIYIGQHARCVEQPTAYLHATRAMRTVGLTRNQMDMMYHMAQQMGECTG